MVARGVAYGLGLLLLLTAYVATSATVDWRCAQVLSLPGPEDRVAPLALLAPETDARKR